MEGQHQAWFSKACVLAYVVIQAISELWYKHVSRFLLVCIFQWTLLIGILHYLGY